jgi:hypothetical protein
VPDNIHPLAVISCRQWCDDMHHFVDIGDMDELGRLVKLVSAKIADEQEWEEDKLRSAVDPSYVPRCMRHG